MFYHVFIAFGHSIVYFLIFNTPTSSRNSPTSPPTQVLLLFLSLFYSPLYPVCVAQIILGLGPAVDCDLSTRSHVLQKTDSFSSNGCYMPTVSLLGVGFVSTSPLHSSIFLSWADTGLLMTYCHTNAFSNLYYKCFFLQ